MCKKNLTSFEPSARENLRRSWQTRLLLVFDMSLYLVFIQWDPDAIENIGGNRKGWNEWKNEGIVRRCRQEAD
jgi:hypothetical protein